jgi:hypothetical protein
LPIVLIPKQTLVASMRFDVVDNLGRPHLVGVSAVGINAQRVLDYECSALDPPPVTVPAGGRRTSPAIGASSAPAEFLELVVGVIIAVPAVASYQVGTAGIPARPGGCFRHLLEMEKAGILRPYPMVTDF